MRMGRKRRVNSRNGSQACYANVLQVMIVRRDKPNCTTEQRKLESTEQAMSERGS